MFDRSRLFPPELDGADRARRARAFALAEAAIAAVDPYRCTRDALAGEDVSRATMFAFGKAAGAMARAAHDAGVRAGIAIVLTPIALEGIDVRVGGHPMPAADAIETGTRAMEIAQALGEGDVALCLVSGGGSSMLELPREGVSIEDIARETRALMRRGADIAELNALRSTLSRIKGGGLARAIAPASILNVVISDVPGHGPELVASGPTIADGARTIVAADNLAARRAMGLDDRPGWIAGEARTIGARLARDAGESAWSWGGESTVTVRGAGRGGRNHELVLGALAAGWTRGLLLALGTDGIDGSSDAAGAFVDTAIARAAVGMDLGRALAKNDSHALFDALGAQLRCGPTGTNVADVVLYLP